MYGLGDVDHLAFRVCARRTTIRDLHGPWDSDGPSWPAPYRHPIDSEPFLRALEATPGDTATERWEHGTLVEVTSPRRQAELTDLWGARRTSGARVGPVTAPAVTAADRARIRSFASRGWLRLLVRAFEHVGCKAAHVDMLTENDLAPFGEVGQAILEARRRPRLAVLEELVESHGGDPDAVFSVLDDMDRALDAGLGTSWIMSQVPDHCLSLWPLRNLMRLADRRGVILRDIRWQDYEAETSYAPDVPVLALEPEIYGAGIEHDITHYLGPVLWTEDQTHFEVANNGVEGDAQAMNNLILACYHKGPAYEGFAGWPGAQLFEWLERSFQLASFPQFFAALRTFTIVLHRKFDGDVRDVLSQLAPGFVDGKHLQDLLTFYPGYVRHDHDYLGTMHPRYVTPYYPSWREALGERIVDDTAELVRRANDLLWELEDVDLRGWQHPLRGSAAHGRECLRLVASRALELRHLCEQVPDGAPFQPRAAALATEGLDMVGAWTELMAQVGAWSDTTPPEDRQASVLARSKERADALDAKSVAYRERLQVFADAVRVAQHSWPEPLVLIPEGFASSTLELYRGAYYDIPEHVGSDMDDVPRILGSYASDASDA